MASLAPSKAPLGLCVVVQENAALSVAGIRACALYSMVDESSDVLKSDPTRKKTDNLAFFYFLL